MRLLFCGVALTSLLLNANVKSGNAYTVDDVFENFRKAYNESRNFSADFEETIFRDGVKSSSRGELTFSKPNLLRKRTINQKDPTQLVQLIVLDGSYSWAYTPLLNQVNKMKLSNPEHEPLLPGIDASLQDVQKNYDMKLVVDEVANRKGVYQLELTPRPHMLSKPLDGGQSPRETLEMWIQAKDWLPIQFGYKLQYDTESNVIGIISLTNIKRDQKLDTGFFKFDIPNGAEVIDISPKE
ncbi:MAG: outer membrane lipoprotein carrier protein LolA [Candidatus Poribacteria bacterium]|nr:outer membrane lipoprotein carrier protein LolA [Candidatus Poribacteria bacterium]MDE0506096.1 outer membrane lipoprotein carrier protein LolA [Candidatus Poribacteria bacterium]